LELSTAGFYSSSVPAFAASPSLRYGAFPVRNKFSLRALYPAALPNFYSATVKQWNIFKLLPRFYDLLIKHFANKEQQ